MRSVYTHHDTNTPKGTVSELVQSTRDWVGDTVRGTNVALIPRHEATRGAQETGGISRVAKFQDRSPVALVDFRPCGRLKAKVVERDAGSALKAVDASTAHIPVPTDLQIETHHEGGGKPENGRHSPERVRRRSCFARNSVFVGLCSKV